MSRGFTLLELVITLTVLGVLLATAAPNFSVMVRDAQIRRFAGELHNYLIQAKSEAVWRNQSLWAHISVATNPSPAGEWKLTVTDSDTNNTGTELLVLNGEAYRHIVLFSGYTSDQIKFDGTRGKVKDGHLKFYIEGQTSKVLRLKSAYAASRIVICGEGGAWFGYPSC
ncbi:Tfp pilus assembly protein FimT/FimU [Vibrio hepatarius]|uniref:Tfp pilus assembly protein FimT/FimU n=1 Tax=Vibrio hepatarius TaxID=171383 RepID=UPI003735CFCE